MRSWNPSLLSFLGWRRVFLPSLEDLSESILFAFPNCASGKRMCTSSPSHTAAWTSHQLHTTLDGGAAVCHIGNTFYSHSGHSWPPWFYIYFFANHQTVCNGGNKIYWELSALWLAITIPGWLQSSPRCTVLYNPGFLVHCKFTTLS